MGQFTPRIWFLFRLNHPGPACKATLGFLIEDVSDLIKRHTQTDSFVVQSTEGPVEKPVGRQPASKVDQDECQQKQQEANTHDCLTISRGVDPEIVSDSKSAF